MTAFLFTLINEFASNVQLILCHQKIREHSKSGYGLISYAVHQITVSFNNMNNICFVYQAYEDD